MSNQYPGGLITKTPVVPTSLVAPGIWTLSQQAAAQATNTWPFRRDAQFPYVTMLLHGDGTNGAQNNTFLDSSTNNFTITRNGNTTQGTFTPYGSNWSNYLNGSSYFTFGTTASNFLCTGSSSGITATFEAWVFPTAYSTGANSYNFSAIHAKGGVYFNFGVRNGAVRFYWYDGAEKNVTSASTSDVPLNTWTHIALTISGSTIKIYINGVLNTTSATYTGVASAGSGTTEYIGLEVNGTYLNGYISNYRFTNTVVYSAAFTPSTTPLTAVSGTALLTCADNRFIDDSTNAFAITANGSPSVQRFSPFSPTTAYSTSVIGGSMYLDGTTDFVKTPSDVNLSSTLLASNFTIECWLYVISLPNAPTIWTNSVSNSDGFSGSYIQTNGTIGTGKYGVNEFNTTNTIKLNAWNHFALVRNSGTLYVYFNGVQDATTGAASTYLNTTATKPMQIGSSNQTSPASLNGYISDFRVVTSALYTASFTPNTTPLTAVTGTNLLLNTTNAGILDNAMMNDLETVGNAQISTSVVKYGTGSLAFDGTGDYLLLQGGQNFTFGTGDFTIEMWIYVVSGLNADIVYYDGRPTSTNGLYNIIYTNSTGKLVYSTNSADRITGTTTLSTGTWYHIALSRSGTSTKLFLNGTQEASTYTDSNSYIVGANRPVIGGNGYTLGNAPLNGYIDDLRITKGVARYTATFTVPDQAFPNG